MKLKNSPIKVVAAVDDIGYYKDFKHSVLDYKREIKIIKLAKNYDGLFNLLQERNSEINVILLDIQISGGLGLHALNEVKLHYPAINVAALMQYNCQDFYPKTFQVLRAGAKVCIEREATYDLVRYALVGVGSEWVYFNKLAGNASIKMLKWSTIVPESEICNNIDFTEKEVAILKLLIQENGTAEIAKAIGLGEGEVNRIRANLKEKVGAKGTAGLVAYAVRNNIG